MQPNLYTCISIGLKKHPIQHYLQQRENLRLLSPIGDMRRFISHKCELAATVVAMQTLT